MKAKNYNRDWHEIFEYDPTSPSGLVWKIPRMFRGKPNFSRIGKPVGSKNGDYWAVGLSNGQGGAITYLIHRIIAVMHFGSIEDVQDVDHMDQNKSNNLIENLRIVDKSINMKNKSMRKDNKSGHIGVSVAGKGNGYLAQYVDVNGEHRTKYFSLARYGEKALELAVQWRNEHTGGKNGY